jgi:hypothetical protein
VLSDFLSPSPHPVLCDLLHVWIPFYLCYAIPNFLLFIRTQALSVSLLVLLFATSFPTLMLRPTYGQRASSWSRGLYFHSIITCAAIFLSIVASITVLIDHNTRGTRQGSVKQAPRTKHVLNLHKAENHPLNRSLGSHPLQVWMGTWASFLILSVISFMTFPSSSICKQQSLRLNFPQTPPSEASK